MFYAMIRRLAWGTMLAAVAFALTSVPPSAQADEGANSGGKPAAAKSRWSHKGLPRFYAKVVTPEQRETILKIQGEYAPKLDELKAKIKELRAQMDALTKERDGKIKAVLTPEQQKQIEEAEAKAQEKAQAKKDRRKAVAEPEKPAEKPADKPAEKAPDAPH
jgi:hypothetical protein